jgi:drug/metabolite transporter (DMT)-like permease
VIAERWKPDLALVVAAFFFGTTFVVVRDAVVDVGPVPFLAVRFLFAGAALWPFARRRPAAPHELRDGVAAGALLLTGYVFQTVGLQYTSPTTSAFITYMLVVFVPIIAFIALREPPHPIVLLGVGIAIVGLVLLTGGAGANSFGRGEACTMITAVAFAGHIVLLSRVARRHDALRLTCIQLMLVGIACLVPGALLGGYAFTASALAAAVGTGVFATAVAFSLMVWAQRTVSPARAAIVLLLEPVFAAALAAVMGDSLTGRTLVTEVLPQHLTAGSSYGQADGSQADQ